MRRAGISFLAILLLGISRLAGAQGGPADLPLTKAEIRATLLAAVAKVDRMYYDSAVGARVSAGLRDAVQQDSVLAMTSSKAFASMINRLLRSIERDTHLRFGYSFEAVVPDTATEDKPPTPAEIERDRRLVAAAGYGVGRVERLDGNIGYVNLTSFEEPSDATDAIVSMMTLVHGTDALIIDLRENGGGSPAMEQFLISYFFPTPVLLGESFIRFKNQRRQWWTHAWVPGPRYDGDVFLLTSSKTHSAAEALAYHLQQRHRATVIGETTKGGAHLTRWEKVTPHFAISIPVGSGTDAVSKKDWERTGVKPDVAVEAAQALHTAHMSALEGALKRATTAAERLALTETLNGLRAAPPRP